MRPTAALISAGIVASTLVVAAPTSSATAIPLAARTASATTASPQATALKAAYQAVLDRCTAKRRNGIDIHVYAGGAQVHRELQSPTQHRVRVTSTSDPYNLYTKGYLDPSYAWSHLRVMDTALGKRALHYLGKSRAVYLKGTRARMHDDDGTGTVGIVPLALCKRTGTIAILPAASEFDDAQWAISSAVKQGTSTVYHLEYGTTPGANTTLVTVDAGGAAVRVENPDPWNATTRPVNKVYTIRYDKIRIALPSPSKTVSFTLFYRAYSAAKVPADIVTTLRDLGMRPTIAITTLAGTRKFARQAAASIRFATRASISAVDTSTGAKLVAKRSYGGTVVFALTWKAGVVSYKRTR